MYHSNQTYAPKLTLPRLPQSNKFESASVVSLEDQDQTMHLRWKYRTLSCVGIASIIHVPKRLKKSAQMQVVLEHHQTGPDVRNYSAQTPGILVRRANFTASLVHGQLLIRVLTNIHPSANPILKLHPNQPSIPTLKILIATTNEPTS